MRIRRTAFAAILAAFSLAACQGGGGEQESKTNSLDNFARSKDAPLNQNQCRGDYELMSDVFSTDLDIVNIHAPDGKEAEALQSKVESALKAVPTEIQTVFFGLGGIIEVSSLTHDICSQGLSKEQKERYAEFGTKITGCWKYQTDYYKKEDGSTEKDPRVVMYIDATPDAIEHSLVRTFGYVLSQVLVKLDYEEGKPHVTTVDGDQHFEKAKKAVAEAFLEDVASSEGKYDLSRFEDLLGKDVLSKDRIARSTAWQALLESRPDDAKAFMDYVFAETFDSQYCSQATRDTMQKDFVQTAGAFKPIHEAILGLKKNLDEVDSAEDLAEVAAKGDELANDSAGEGDKADQDQDQDQDPAVSQDDWQSKASFELGIFGGFFRGVGRVLGAIGRGIVRFGGAVLRTGARIARGALRIGAAVVRGVGRAAFRIFRGAVRVARGVVIGAGRIIRGAARVTLAVGRAVLRGTGRVIRGLFGPAYAFASEAGMVLAEGILDTDGDGISDPQDLCSHTSKGARVHKSNSSWLGCSGGQYRDRDLRRWGYNVDAWYAGGYR